MDDLPTLYSLTGITSLPDRPVRVLGVDLGTTNSTVAEKICSPGEMPSTKVRCLEINQRTSGGIYTHVTVPSVVALHEGRVWVGEGAKRLRGRRGLEIYRNIFWECKNHMGIRRTYHKAPPGFQTAREICEQVLRFLYETAKGQNQTPINRVVVTVPASFQAAQRIDTLEAAKLAGLEISGRDLLDEPIAAFLDYLFTNSVTCLGNAGESKTLIVFDFGGETCDAAVFRITIPHRMESLKVVPLLVSRYHRLGGGDIDAAIVHEVFIPQIREQNNLSNQLRLFVTEDKDLGLRPERKLGMLP